MNTPRNTPPDQPRKDASDASGQHEGLRHPVDDDRRVEQRLDNVGLEDQGDALEDRLGARRSSGTPDAEPAPDAEPGTQERRRH
jgi:hypothetical protein